MQIQMRVEYAARALIDLAEHHGEGLIRASEIARRRGIPEPFLEQVLLRLKGAGLIRSSRGPAGGYELIQGPTTITLGQIAHALGEEFLEISCMEHGQCLVFPGACWRMSGSSSPQPTRRHWTQFPYRRWSIAKRRDGSRARITFSRVRWLVSV